MTTRALTRAGLAPVPHIGLPVAPRPQYVNDRGIEVDEQVFCLSTDSVAGTGQEDMYQQAEDIKAPEEIVYDTIEVDKEPLLSLAER